MQLFACMQREWRPAIGYLNPVPVGGAPSSKVEEAGHLAAPLDELGEAIGPCPPEAARQRAQKRSFVDHVEGRLGDRREEVGAPRARGVRPEDHARRFDRLGAEIDPQDLPAALGEAAHVPRAAASGNEHAAAIVRGEGAQLRGDFAGVPRDEARLVTQIPELRVGGVAARELRIVRRTGRSHAPMVN